MSSPTANSTEKSGFRAQYRISEYVGLIPNGTLAQEKAELAAKLGISIAQLNRIIRQNSEPNGTQLRIIADFFGVTVNDLYSEN